MERRKILPVVKVRFMTNNAFNLGSLKDRDITFYGTLNLSKKVMQVFVKV
jgi:hypothetical protein